MSIRSSLSIIFLALLANVGGALVIVKLAVDNQRAIGSAAARRYESYQLADELRQTSDDLTRMARLFVVSGEARFKDYFGAIRDIRDGKMSRPVDYHRIYWDYVTASGQKPRASGEPVALEEMMRRMQFTNEDFELLSRAKRRSDNLISIEEQAMNAMLGLFPDARGDYIVPGVPDPELARRLMHSDDYLRAKAVIMEPIEEFFTNIEARTTAEVERLRRRANRLNRVVLSIMSVAVGLLLVSFAIVRRRAFSSQSSGEVSEAASGSTPSFSSLLTVWPLMVAAVVTCIAIAAVAWSIERQLEDRVRQRTGYTLRAVMHNSMRSVEGWLNRAVADARLLADLPVVRAWITEQEPGDRLGDASAAVMPDEVASILEPLVSRGGYEGYIVMSPEGRVIADSDGHAYASDRFVSSLPEALFQQIASPPAYSFISLPHWQGDGVTDPDSLASQIVIASGIRGETGQVLAVLVFRLSPEGEFSTILQRGRIGDTGESFAFNRAGRLISELRFGDRLRQIGILGEGQGTILNVEVRDPGGNLMTGYQPHPNKSDWPFSFMARRAIAGNAGVDLDGYNDIRGVPVIAAWGWNEAFGFGVATELEAGEAYETLRWYQKQAVTGTVMAIVLILGLTTLFIRTRLRIVAVNTRLNDAYRIIKKHKERMEEELNIGREIQMSMIPLTFPAFPEYREFSIYADLQPAREVGGDYYDFFFMDEERICLCVGDVSGKGVPAALFMAVTKTLIKSRAVDDRSTASIITHVNDALSQDNKACMFVTLFVAILNVKSGAFTYTNAGHNKPYIRRSSGSVEQVEDLHGPVVGPVEGLIFGESALNLYKGDLLFIFTDGINEAMNGNGELFTDERIIDSLVCGDAGSAEAMVREVVTHVGEFVGSADQSDDITALAVQFFGKSNGENDEGMLIAVVNRIEEVEKVQEKLNEYLKGSGVGEEVNQQLNIVIDELLANIIRYGYGDEAEHEIEIRAELVDGMIRLILTDDGIPFNPLGTRAPFTGSSLDEREAGGLGIHLVRNLVDDISYRRQTGKNVLSVQKKIGEEREGQL